MTNMDVFHQNDLSMNNSLSRNITDERRAMFALNTKFEDFPDPDTEFYNGVNWGSYKNIFTPAYWKTQYLMHNENKNKIDNRLGSNLLEEISACMLGGFGIPSNVGLAAFHRLKQNNLLKPGTSKTIIKEVLSEPIKTSSGNTVHYRFVNQKSEYLALFLNRDDIYDIQTEDAFELRKWLLQIKGIGLKTASWITRNWLESDRVAIIDIHLLRAGRLTGIFPEVNDINSHYLFLESQFVEFCEKLNVKASIMDAIMWHQMRRSNIFVIKMLNTIN